MKKFATKNLVIIVAFLLSFSLFQSQNYDVQKIEKEIECKAKSNELILGCEQFSAYLPQLQGKKVAIVTNQTGVFFSKSTTLEKIHIVDFLMQNSSLEIKKIFAPEHGFRGTDNAGEIVKDGKDVKTNLPIISLYGKNKKPTAEQLADIDVIIFDIQDVGVRFYTYISTLHYVMEAAAENGKKVIVFDRPNPNNYYIDGPVLDKKFASFVGMHPVPVVYGMTIGEYAKMINGEKWLKNKIQCYLKVIPLKNYKRTNTYSLPVKPSPNLPNDDAINLYPTTCFFEGINASEGRGTDFPFQVYGSPYFKNMKFQFTPKPNEAAKEPRFNGQICYGEDLRHRSSLSSINLSWILNSYKNYQSKEPFFIKNSGQIWFDMLAGTDALRKQIIAGKSEKEIRKTWSKDIEKFILIRAKYLIYK